MFQMQHHSDKLDLTTHLCFVVGIGCIQHIVQCLQLRGRLKQQSNTKSPILVHHKLSCLNVALNSVDAIFFCIIWLIITEHNVQM